MHPAYIDKIPSLGEWKALHQEAVEPTPKASRRRSRVVREPKRRHNPQDEEAPNHIFYAMDTRDMDKKTGILLEQLEVSLSQPKYAHLGEVQKLVEKIHDLKTGPPRHDYSYALVGDHGKGKSTLVNCLLGRLNLASQSGGTKSCTQYATRYEHLPGTPDDTNMSNVTLQFFDRKERSKTTQQHMKRIYHVRHASVDTDDAYNDAAGIKITDCDKRLCEEGINFLALPIQGCDSTEQELEKFINDPLSFTNGVLKEWCLKKQDERLSKLGVGANGTIAFANVLDEADPQHTDNLKIIADVRKIADSLAPLLDTVIIATGGLLLSYGLVFLDIPGKSRVQTLSVRILIIPGYGDRSQIRIASANAHRRGAHGELIVAATERVEDSEAVDESILKSIRAHGNDNTILVINKLDTMEDLGDKDLANMLENNPEHPFMDIKLEQMKTNSLFEDGNQSESTVLDRYDDYLIACAQGAAKRHLIGEAVTRLVQRYKGGISVIPACASVYHQLMDPYYSKDPAFGPNMSGIPHLRQTLLSMIAGQKLQTYKTHYFEALPSIVDTCQRIRVKTLDKNGTLASFRVSFQQHFKNAIRTSRAAKENTMLTMILPMFMDSERLSITKRVESSVRAWSNSRIVHWQTFRHTLSHGGIPISLNSKAYRYRDYVNWNRDLLETMERPTKINTMSDSYPAKKEHVLHWKSKMLAQIASITRSIGQPFSELGPLVNDIVKESAAPFVLNKRTLEEWKKVEISMHDLVIRFPEKIKEAIEKVYRDITTEEDIGCMIAKMNEPAYDSAENQPHGPGVYARQRQSLLHSLHHADVNNKAFVHRYEALAKQKMKEHLTSVTEQFIIAMEAKLTGFTAIMGALVETDIYSASEHAAAREILRKWLPEFQDQLLECQRKFQGHHDQQDVQFIGIIKRSNDNEIDSPLKRMKVDGSKQDDSYTEIKAEDMYSENEDSLSENDLMEDNFSEDDLSEDDLSEDDLSEDDLSEISSTPGSYDN